jgi:Flp pilus assembly pilin Flp
VEYGLVVAFISVVAIGSLMAMGGQVSNVYTTINQQLTASTTGGATASSRGH